MRIAITALVICITALAASAQSALKLVPRKYSEVEIAFGKRSVIFNLDDALTGTNGSLPGNPPHKYRTLFTAERDGLVYLVANVQSSSPITSPMAPCGGDSPQAILWIRADKTLKNRKIQSEIYASCSYNYYDSKVKQSKNGIVVTYGGEKKKRLEYDNVNPDKGLMISVQ
ncbi:MAG TPA: hypothetical protein PK108_15160 [Pyrinomonadaceae bacterium]|nr:hypothetical protein [Acidobacteriota bacterium]HQZ94984.1 hypothetical protein [Pyrinomonadaceae bacterium]HRA41877.1 hypothetical protein [Pyrinomonadaceae bacterium]